MSSNFEIAEGESFGTWLHDAIAANAQYLDAADTLPDLPIWGIRSVCRVAGVDWAGALPTSV